MNPTVTVGICVKNGGEVIKLALTSISKQNFPHDLMELVIVDDGSSDDTLRTLNSFAGETDIVTRIYESGGKGLAFSRQMVVERARGKYIVWVDADQEHLQDSVKKHFDFMEKNPEIVAACGNEIFRRQALAAALESMSVAFKNRANTGGVDVGGGIFRVEALRKIGGFDTNLKAAGEDVEVVYRMTKAGMKVARDSSEFYHNHRKTWKALWNEYFWWGYGMHYVRHKRKSRFPKSRILPFSFLVGCFHAVKVYRIYGQKKVLLLPFQYSFKNLSWCMGYLSSHIEHHEYQGEAVALCR